MWRYAADLLVIIQVCELVHLKKVKGISEYGGGGGGVGG